jgi:hypothetical protein
MQEHYIKIRQLEEDIEAREQTIKAQARIIEAQLHKIRALDRRIKALGQAIRDLQKTLDRRELVRHMWVSKVADQGCQTSRSHAQRSPSHGQG